VLQQETFINTSIVAFSACFTKLNLDQILTDEQFFDWLIGSTGLMHKENFTLKISNRPYAF
jgi:hypothetical protein